MSHWFLQYQRWPEYQGALQLTVLCQRLYEEAPRSRLAQDVDVQCSLLVQGIARGSAELSRAHAVDALHQVLGCLTVTRSMLDRMRRRRTGPQACVTAAVEVAERMDEQLLRRIAQLLGKAPPQDETAEGP